MKSLVNTDVIVQLEAWLSEQCDGDWEHTYGMTIETTDNPGWYVQIDLDETPLSDVVKPFHRSERSETNWIQFEIMESKFIGSAGIGNLMELLQCFLVCVTEERGQ